MYAESFGRYYHKEGIKMGALNIVIYSGGMDSYTVLRMTADAAKRPGDDLIALSFDYSQRHSRELIAAARVCQRLAIEHMILNLRSLAPILRGSSLTTPSIEVPEGHFEAEIMRQTIVPGRNTIMLSLALAYTESRMLQEPNRWENAYVWYGAHSGDHHIYPDCRPAYVEAMQRTFAEASNGKISLAVPYLHGDKESILMDGFGAGFDYAETWTCYKGGEIACGKCGSCQERLSAFAAIGKDDPLEYETRALIAQSPSATG